MFLTMHWCCWQTWDFRDILEYVTFLSKTFVINIIVIPEFESSWTWKSDLTKFWVGKNDRHPTGSDRYGSCGYRTVSPSPFLFVSKQILLDQKRIQPYSKSLPWTKFKRKFTRKFAFRIGSRKSTISVTLRVTERCIYDLKCPVNFFVTVKKLPISNYFERRSNIRSWALCCYAPSRNNQYNIPYCRWRQWFYSRHNQSAASRCKSWRSNFYWQRVRLRRIVQRPSSDSILRHFNQFETKICFWSK